MSPILAPNTLDFISHSEAQTRRLGLRLAKFLEVGDIVALTGDLGAGKTRWAQGVCQGLGVSDPVISPSFTMVNEYAGRFPVYHIDLYRIEEPAEVLTLGLEEYLYGDGVTLIEWAGRAENFLPEDYLTIELYYLEQSKRRIVIRPHGERFLEILIRYRKSAFGG